MKRDQVESALLTGIKDQFTPKVIKAMVKTAQVRLRQVRQPDKLGLHVELKRLEHPIGNVVDTLTAVGKSDTLTARLRELEADKAAIAAQVACEPSAPRIFPDVEKRIRGLIASLERLPENPHRDDVTYRRK